jgi:hypothetical protein
VNYLATTIDFNSVGREIPGNIGKSAHRCGPAFQNEYDLIRAIARGAAIT